jgi:hypothetical protein
MTITTTKAVAKVAAVAAGLAMATSMLSLAPIAHAATTTTTTTSCSIGTDALSIGSTGAEVTCLQQALIADGYSIPAGATGYFGTETQAAVAAWQKAAGVSPAAGYFGPISHAAWTSSTTTVTTTSTVAGCAPGAMFSSTTGQSCATSTVPGCAPGAMFSSTTGQSCGGSSVTTYPAGCTSSVGFSPTTGVACSSGVTTTSSGNGVGYLTNISSLGDVTSDLNEGDPSTAVVGFSAYAQNGNVTVQRVQATFTICGAGTVTSNGVNIGCPNTTGVQSVNLNKYVSDVSLWDGSTEIADVNPSTASLNGRVWTVLFSGLNANIPAGTTANFHVMVTPLTSIGINENNATVVASLLPNSVNAVGSDGISDTYISTEIDQDFTVSAANIGTLTVSQASDNPNASIVAVGSSTTTGVKLLSFNLQAKNQPVSINTLVASLGTSDNNVSDVVNTVYLEQNGTVIASKTASSGTYNVITFNNINQTIPENNTVNYDLVVDLKADQAYSDGTTLVASTSVSGWTVSDANGATVTPSSAADGNTQTLSASGISIALGTPSATDVTCTQTSCGDTGNYSIPFTVTAGDNDIFISAVTGINHAAGDVDYATTTSSNTGVTNQGVANLAVAPQSSGGTQGDTAGAYRVPANTSRTFTLNVTYTATSTGYTGLQLTDIYYGTSATALTSDYTSNINTFQTNNINLVKH